MIYIGNFFSWNIHALNQRRIRPSSSPAASFIFFHWSADSTELLAVGVSAITNSSPFLMRPDLEIYEFRCIVAVTHESPNDFLLVYLTGRADSVPSAAIGEGQERHRSYPEA
jgi:hypothetical protein